MRGKGIAFHARAKRQSGYSLTELVVALGVAMVLMAVGLPAFLRFYRSYQLTNAATEVRDYLRLARYEAIRINKKACLDIENSGGQGMTSLTVLDYYKINDPSCLPDGIKTNYQTYLGAGGVLVASPSNLSGLAPTLGPLPSGITAPNQITFDARGAVCPLGPSSAAACTPASVNVFFLSSAVAPEAGYRAVLLLPAGSAQIWTGDTTGNWQKIQ